MMEKKESPKLRLDSRVAEIRPNGNLAEKFSIDAKFVRNIEEGFKLIKSSPKAVTYLTKNVSGMFNFQEHLVRMEYQAN